MLENCQTTDHITFQLLYPRQPLPCVAYVCSQRTAWRRPTHATAADPRAPASSQDPQQRVVPRQIPRETTPTKPHHHLIALSDTCKNTPRPQERVYQDALACGPVSQLGKDGWAVLLCDCERQQPALTPTTWRHPDTAPSVLQRSKAAHS
jgi:hypothetical protein